MRNAKRYDHSVSDGHEALELIKWCRANLGERSIDWDFSGGGGKNHKITIWVRNSESELKYVMAWRWRNE